MNCASHGLVATVPYRTPCLRREKSPVRMPETRGNQTRDLSERIKYLSVHELTKDPWKVNPKIKKALKRKTIFRAPQPESFEANYNQDGCGNDSRREETNGVYYFR
jgi:hypothetical protein